MARRETHQCPFARSGIVLTKLLCDILHVGEVGKHVTTYMMCDNIIVTRMNDVCSFINTVY